MKTIHKNYGISVALGLAIVFFSMWISPARAAEFFFGTHAKELGVGATFEVGVFLNTNSESVNAIEGRILFPEDVLELREIRRGNSVVNFWVEEPLYEKGKGIYYAGIIPGGYEGSYGKLFSLIFSTKKEGSVTIQTVSEKILLNDGLGSEAVITRAPISIVIEKDGSVTEFLPTADTTPPEIFPVEISRDPSLFDGKWFAVFTAQDKGSGVARYEISEMKQKLFGLTHTWTTTESPHLLRDQNLQSIVTVKAIDRNGNEQIVTIPAKNPLAWYANYENWFILIGIILVVWILKHRKCGIYRKIS